MDAVLASFSKINDRIKNARANTGTGSLGWWPEESDGVVCNLLEMKVAAADFEWKANKSDKVRQKQPGVKIQTLIQLAADPTNPHPDQGPRKVNGSPFIIPLDTSNLPANQIQRVEIQEERLKGLFTTALQTEDIPDTAAAIKAVIDKIAEKQAAGTGLFMKVAFRYSDSDRAKNADGTPKRVPDAEYYQELVAT